MRKVAVFCDGCSTEFDGDVEELRPQGWTRSKSEDYCEGCSAERKYRVAIEKQLKSDELLTLNQIRGSMSRKTKKASCATYLQKIVRMEAALQKTSPCIVDGTKFINAKPSPLGYSCCVTCGKPKHWKEANGGHYISRKHAGTVLDRRNLHFQCVYCNDHLGGNYAAYHQFMLSCYGQDVVDDLHRRKHVTPSHNRPQLAKIKVDLRAEVARLEAKLKECA